MTPRTTRLRSATSTGDATSRAKCHVIATASRSTGPASGSIGRATNPGRRSYVRRGVRTDADGPSIDGCVIGHYRHIYAELRQLALTLNPNPIPNHSPYFTTLLTPAINQCSRIRNLRFFRISKNVTFYVFF